MFTEASKVGYYIFNYGALEASKFWNSKLKTQMEETMFDIKKRPICYIKDTRELEATALSFDESKHLLHWISTLRKQLQPFKELAKGIHYTGTIDYQPCTAETLKSRVEKLAEQTDADNRVRYMSVYNNLLTFKAQLAELKELNRILTEYYDAVKAVYTAHINTDRTAFKYKQKRTGTADYEEAYIDSLADKLASDAVHQVERNVIAEYYARCDAKRPK